MLHAEIDINKATLVGNNETYDGIGVGAITYLPLEFKAHVANTLDCKSIESLSIDERSDKALAILLNIAKQHFSQNPLEEYIDILSHPDYQNIKDILTYGLSLDKDINNIQKLFSQLSTKAEKQGYILKRPSYTYFFLNKGPDSFGIIAPGISLREYRSKAR